MKQTDRTFKSRVFQVSVEFRQVFRHNQTLIYRRQVGKRSHVEHFVRLIQFHVFSCSHTPGNEKSPLNIMGPPTWRCVDKYLLNTRHGIQRRLTTYRWICRYPTPTGDIQCFIFNVFLKNLPGSRSNFRICIHEHHTDSKNPAQSHAFFFCHLFEK